jgi:serine/threonine-protein kinase HipA
LAPLYDVASMLPYDQESHLQSAMKIGSTWRMAAVTDTDWTAVGKRFGLAADDAISRARVVRARIPSAFSEAAAEAGIPDQLRDRAQWIAELIAAHVEGRRDRSGRIDVPDRPVPD